MARYENRRAQIEAAAVRLFAERGVDAVSMRDIGAAAGVSGPGVLAHYRSKDTLVSGIYQEGFAHYAAAIRAAGATPGPFRDRLAAIIEAVLRLHDEDEDRFRFLVLRQHDHLGSIPADGSNPVQVIREAVAAAIAAGDLPPRDPDLAALALIGLVVQPATGRLYGRLGGPLAPRAPDITAMAWGALTTPPIATSPRKTRSPRP